MGLRTRGFKTDVSERPQSSKTKEHIQDLLARKLLKKFAQYPQAKDVVPGRVARFVAQNRLNQASLYRLEQEIGSCLKGQCKPPSKASKNGPDKARQKTVSKRNEASKALSRSFCPVEHNEERDWDAILKFNTELHHEEILREEEKKREQQRIIKNELERQQRERLEIRGKERKESEVYQQLHTKHLRLMDEKEVEKAVKRKEYELKERANLNKQLQEDIARKKKQQEEIKNEEKNYIERVQQEILQEQDSLYHKKLLEREHQRKMMKEDELNRKRQRDERARVKEQEKKDLESYMNFIDRQESDQRKREREKERRIQMLMSNMASSTIQEMDRKKMEDEENVARHREEAELRDKLDEQQRIRMVKDNQEDMRNFLKKQMKEKKAKAVTDKKEDYKQAEMWKKDVKLHKDEERLIRLKTLEANREYAECLKKQIEENRKSKATAMSREEYLMNKRLMEEIESRNRQRSTFIS